jgi:hypothetical protein
VAAAAAAVFLVVRHVARMAKLSSVLSEFATSFVHVADVASHLPVIVMACSNSSTPLAAPTAAADHCAHDAPEQLQLYGHVLSAPQLHKLMRDNISGNRTGADNDAGGSQGPGDAAAAAHGDDDDASILGALESLPVEQQLSASLAAAAAGIALVQQPDGSCAIAAVPPRCGWLGAAVAAAAAAAPETGTMAIVCGRIDRALQRRLGEADAALAAQLAAACGVGGGFAAADMRTTAAAAAAAAAEWAAGTGSPDGYSNTCHAQQQHQQQQQHRQEDQMPVGSASEDFEARLRRRDEAYSAALAAALRQSKSAAASEPPERT